jgi:hypothetical protein
MKNLLVVLSLALLATSCNSNRYEKQAVRFHDDGRAKATVILTSVYDHQNIQLPWNLAEDLTTMIKSRLIHKSNLFIVNPPVPKTETLEEHTLATPIINEHHDENKTLNVHPENLKVKFSDGEFVVFMELAEHKVYPKQESDSFLEKITPSYALDLAMRIRIYDLRGTAPKIVLQELVQERHLLPKQFAKLDFDSAFWGRKTYSISPIGLAHMHFAKEIARRIDSYLILAKTN